MVDIRGVSGTPQYGTPQWPDKSDIAKKFHDEVTGFHDDIASLMLNPELRKDPAFMGAFANRINGLNVLSRR